MEQVNDNFANEPIAVRYDNSMMTLSRDSLFAVLSQVSEGDIPIAIKYLVDKLAKMNKTVSTVRNVQSHVWDDYKLSSEVLSLMPKERKALPDHYKSLLSDILDEKYK